MALQRVLVTDFSFGAVSKRYAGRITSEIRTKAAETIEGFILQSDGGVGRRKGSIFIRDGVGITPKPNRLYDANSIPSFLVYRDGENRWIGYIEDSPRVYRALKLGSADVMSVTDSGLQAGTPLYSTNTFYDPTTEAEYVHIWTDSDAFHYNIADATTLTAVTRLNEVDMALVYQNRLIGVRRDTGEIHMSKAMNLFDFRDQDPAGVPMWDDETAYAVDDMVRHNYMIFIALRAMDAPSPEPEDGEDWEFLSDATIRPLYAVPDWAGVEKPTWLVARQSVYIGTDLSEHEVFSSFPYFDHELGGLMIRRVTEMGTENARYLGAGLAVQSESQVMVITYTGQDFTYQAMGLSDRIDNNRLITIGAQEFGTHRYLLMLDVDGVLYCYLSAPAAGVDGWMTLAREVGWVWVFGKDAYVAIERDGGYSVEVFPLDALQHPGARTRRQAAMFLANDAHGDRGGYLVYDGTNLTGDVLPATTEVSVYTIDLENKHATHAGELNTNANGALVAGEVSSLIGYVSGEAYIYAHEADVVPEGRIVTLPLGGLIGTRARIAKVVLQVVDSTAARVRVNDGMWEEVETDEPYSGTWEFRVEHSQELEPRVEVQPVGAHPLNVYQILVEVDVGG